MISLYFSTLGLEKKSTTLKRSLQDILLICAEALQINGRRGRKSIDKHAVGLNLLQRASQINTPLTVCYSCHTINLLGLHLAVWASVCLFWNVFCLGATCAI